MEDSLQLCILQEGRRWPLAHRLRSILHVVVDLQAGQRFLKDEGVLVILQQRKYEFNRSSSRACIALNDSS